MFCFVQMHDRLPNRKHAEKRTYSRSVCILPFKLLQSIIRSERWRSSDCRPLKWQTFYVFFVGCVTYVENLCMFGDLFGAVYRQGDNPNVSKNGLQPGCGKISRVYHTLCTQSDRIWCARLDARHRHLDVRALHYDTSERRTHHAYKRRLGHAIFNKAQINVTHTTDNIYIYNSITQSSSERACVLLASYFSDKTRLAVPSKRDTVRYRKCIRMEIERVQSRHTDTQLRLAVRFGLWPVCWATY